MEMVITLVLVAILAGTGARVFASLLDAYLVVQSSAPVISEGHVAMERMVREVRLARLSAAPWADSTALSFVSSATEDTIAFYQASLGEGAIVMNHNGTEKVLAQHVQADTLRFTAPLLGDDAIPLLVTVAFTLGNGMPLRTAVYVPSHRQ